MKVGHATRRKPSYRVLQHAVRSMNSDRCECTHSAPARGLAFAEGELVEVLYLLGPSDPVALLGARG